MFFVMSETVFIRNEAAPAHGLSGCIAIVTGVPIADETVVNVIICCCMATARTGYSFEFKILFRGTH